MTVRVPALGPVRSAHREGHELYAQGWVVGHQRKRAGAAQKAQLTCRGRGRLSGAKREYTTVLYTQPVLLVRKAREAQTQPGGGRRTVCVGDGGAVPVGGQADGGLHDGLGC